MTRIAHFHTHEQEYHVPSGDESEGDRLERLLVEEAVARRIEVCFEWQRTHAHGTDTAANVIANVAGAPLSRCVV